MGFHAASPDKSERLKRILTYLRGCGERGATSWELMTECRTVAIATCISELRHAGYNVRCDYERKAEGGGSVWRYRLIETPQLKLFALLIILAPLGVML